MIKNILKLLEKTPSIKKFLQGQASLKVIYLTVVVIFFAMGLFIHQYLWQFKYRGIVDLSIILQAVGTFGATVTAITILSKFLKDDDNDGIPDVLEEAKNE